MHRFARIGRRSVVSLAAGSLFWATLGASSAFAEPWATAPAADNSQLISQLFWLTLVLAAVVFVLVEGLIIYSSLRFRRRNPLPTVEPPQIHGNTRLEVMWAVVPALILVGLFALSVRTMTALAATSDPAQVKDGLHVRVEGFQFGWSFQYQDAGVQSTNVLVLPIDTPVVFEVTARDVIHSFWVPELGGKIDAVPGKVNHVGWKPLKEGKYRGVCAELCGAGHAGMLFDVEVRSQAGYQQWLEEQRGGGTASSAGAAAGSGAADQGKQLIASKGCGGCHVVPGVQGANGAVGPSLAGVASRKAIAAGAVSVNGPDDLKKWIMNPQALKPATTMPSVGLSDTEASAIVDYLVTLK